MNEQQQQVAQVASANEEMSASVVDVAKKSTEASGNANESGKVPLTSPGVGRLTPTLWPPLHHTHARRTPIRSQP